MEDKMHMDDDEPMDMMPMYFHSSTHVDHLLFKSFTITNAGHYVGALLFAILLGLVKQFLSARRMRIATAARKAKSLAKARSEANIMKNGAWTAVNETAESNSNNNCTNARQRPVQNQYSQSNNRNEGETAMTMDLPLMGSKFEASATLDIPCELRWTAKTAHCYWILRAADGLYHTIITAIAFFNMLIAMSKFTCLLTIFIGMKDITCWRCLLFMLCVRYCSIQCWIICRSLRG